jgi:hypothetical protein
LETDIDRALAQLINLGFMRSERQLNLGVEIVANAGEDQIMINATSERPTVAHTRCERLSSELADLPAPADLQFHLLHNIARAFGFAVDFTHRETSTNLTFRRG